MTFDSTMRHEARFYEKTTWENVTCHLCPHNCAIAPSRSGVCGIRTNRDGRLYLDIYGRISGKEVLNGEDLPLFHYKPSIQWLQVGGRGCTMRCPFCNTYRFSQTGGVRLVHGLPEELVSFAKESQCSGISFGVNEPAPMHEYIFDVFERAHAAGLNTHLATGGMWDPDALREMAAVTDAVTVGIKSIEPTFLSEKLGGHMETILGNIDLLMMLDVHVEISWLVIPGVSDQPAQAIQFMKSVMAHDHTPPIILLPYEPDYTWREPAAATLEDLRRFHKAFSGYPAPIYEFHAESSAMNTVCTGCGRPLIRRGIAGLIITTAPSGEPRSKCPSCGAPVPYVTE